MRPLDTIERKTLLYRSGLGFHCINHVLGCSHGCRYPCYALLMARHHGRVRHSVDWGRPRIVGNALALLERELTRKRVLPSDVHLCLTTDPFMVGHPEVETMSLAIIERLNRSGIRCSLLTKGQLPEELADRGRFPCDNTHGISLVSLDEGFRRSWEPGAAPYAERIEALRRLHDAGRRTRVHIEPYPTPGVVVQDLSAILAEVAFVDHIYFSGWNYNPRVPRDDAAEAFYRSQSHIVQAFCSQRGIECQIG
ncbi:MAG: radical SAM protein [Holophagae bacterium]|nr:MAG: radical SAM protein [Holophagae bacterium]